MFLQNTSRQLLLNQPIPSFCPKIKFKVGKISIRFLFQQTIIFQTFPDFLVGKPAVELLIRKMDMTQLLRGRNEVPLNLNFLKKHLINTEKKFVKLLLSICIYMQQSCYFEIAPHFPLRGFTDFFQLPVGVYNLHVVYGRMKLSVHLQ